MNNLLAFLPDSSQLLVAMALLAVAAASLVIGAGLISRAREAQKHSHRIDEAVAARSGKTVERETKSLRARIVEFGVRGVASSLGKTFVADEDRMLLDQCGRDDPAGRAWFFLSRTVLGFGLPVFGIVFYADGSLLRTVMIAFFGFAVGYMAPKYYMRRRAAQRRESADKELPLMIDLLRLFQGVGLSVDQTLQIIAKDFAGSMPVLCAELEHASAQYRTGRTREASLQRFAKVYNNDDMASVVELIVQVDRFGGAVQEPLKQFSERMRERRRSEMKAQIGRLTVKMTGVMVVTLLPALMVVTGGAGFLAIIRALTRLQ